MSVAFVRYSCYLLCCLALGCVGDSHRIVREQALPSLPQKLPPSPEAAVILSTLGDKDFDVGGVWYSEAPRRLSYLEYKLREVGARLGENGKVYDRYGREVYVWENGPGFGNPPPEETLRQLTEEREQKLQELRKRYTVIELPYFGGDVC
jgi:hypothetical protein